MTKLNPIASFCGYELSEVRGKSVHKFFTYDGNKNFESQHTDKELAYKMLEDKVDKYLARL